LRAPPAVRGVLRPARVRSTGRRCRLVGRPLGGHHDYFFFDEIFARMSRLERIRRSSPSTVISVPPYYE
jgi:hypothetical protein